MPAGDPVRTVRTVDPPAATTRAGADSNDGDGAARAMDEAGTAAEAPPPDDDPAAAYWEKLDALRVHKAFATRYIQTLEKSIGRADLDLRKCTHERIKTQMVQRRKMCQHIKNYLAHFCLLCGDQPDSHEKKVRSRPELAHTCLRGWNSMLRPNVACSRTSRCWKRSQGPCRPCTRGWGSTVGRSHSRWAAVSRSPCGAGRESRGQGGRGADGERKAEEEKDTLSEAGGRQNRGRSSEPRPETAVCP